VLFPTVVIVRYSQFEYWRQTKWFSTNGSCWLVVYFWQIKLRFLWRSLNKLKAECNYAVINLTKMLW